MKNKTIIALAILFSWATLFSTSLSGEDFKNKPLARVVAEKSGGQQFLDVAILHQEQSTKASIGALNDYKLFEYDNAKATALLKKAPQTINFIIPNGTQEYLELELVKSDIFSNDFTTIEMPSGRTVDGDLGIHYQGIVKGQPNSIAAISIFENEVSGLICKEESKGNLVLGKLGDSNEHIIYEDYQLKHLQNFECHTENDFEPYTLEELTLNTKNAEATKCPEIFFDVGTDIYNDKGGTTGARNFIVAIFNQVATLYANENITIKTSNIIVWSSNKPFSDNLDSYRSYRSSNSWNGDLAHYVTYNHSGGVAYLNAVCNNTYGYGVSGINSSYSNVPTYSWTVGVVAHELGHNFGSNHTHACVWNGNNTAIDGCYTTEGSCSKPAIPSDGGTIMSYCHLTNVGINFNKGFGSQPSNVMRNTIASASCVGSCSGGGGGKAEMQSPFPGSTFGGSSVTFSWIQPSGATSFHLYVGSTGAGSKDIYNSSVSNSSVNVSGIPTNGSAIYVRLWTYSGSWEYNDYTYIAYTAGGGGDAPSVPTNLRHGGANSSGVWAVWNTVSNATDYTVQQWVNGSWQVKATTSNYYYWLTGNVGSTIYWRVRANNSYGSSAYSSWVSYTLSSNFPDPDKLVAPRTIEEGIFEVYPVPASDELNIKLPVNSGLIKLVSITGKLVIEMEVTGDEMKLDLSDIKKGIYILNFETKDNSFRKKIVIN